MKIPPLPPLILRKAGFTLVELLVVMGIIAILAAVSMQVGITVLNEAKKTKAANTANQIQTAVLNYYTEYSVYPTASGAAAGDFKLDETDSTSQWPAMIECLSGGISPSSGATVSLSTFTNTRAIAFLSLKASDVDNGTTSTSIKHKDAPLNPLPYTSASPYFNMAIDGDYDGIIGVAPSAVTSLPNFSGTFSATGGGTTTSGVAVWANCSPSGSTTQQGWYVHTY